MPEYFRKILGGRPEVLAHRSNRRGAARHFIVRRLAAPAMAGFDVLVGQARLH